MKFEKILRKLVSEMLPDWQDKFLSYKDLKKQLKIIYPKEESSSRVANSPKNSEDDYDRPSKRPGLTKEVNDFPKLLEREIEKLNKFFEGQEENYIILLRILQNKFSEAKGSSEEQIIVGRAIADLHGQMVLLESYSLLNYTGLVKILKKYDKRSGDLLRSPFIQKVLQEPFVKTEVLNKLVRECVVMLEILFLRHQLLVPLEDNDPKEGGGLVSQEQRTLRGAREELVELEIMENTYMRLATLALNILKEIRSGSSTRNEFSLPPME